MPVWVRNVSQAALRPGGRLGVLAPDETQLSHTTLTLTANQAYLNRFYLVDPLAVVSIAFVITTAAGSNDSCDVGIYDSAGNRLASAGATAGKLNTGSNVVSSVALSVNLPGNSVYFAALSCGAVGSTAAILLGSNNGSTAYSSLWGATDTNMIAGYKSAAHPLPSTVTSKGTQQFPPLLAVRGT